MTPRWNARVGGGYTDREGRIVLMVTPMTTQGQGLPRPVVHHTALPDHTRVRIEGGKIVEAEGL